MSTPDKAPSGEIIQEAFTLVVGDPNNTDFLARGGRLTVPDSYLFFVPLTGKDVLKPITTLPVSNLETQSYVAIPRSTGAQALDEMIEQAHIAFKEGDTHRARTRLIAVMEQAGWDSSIGTIDPKEAFFDVTTTPQWHIPRTAKTPSYKPTKGLFSFATPSAIHDEQRMFSSAGGAKNLAQYLEPILVELPAPEELSPVEDEATRTIRKKEKAKFKKGKHPEDALEGPREPKRRTSEVYEDGEKPDGKNFARSTVDKAILPEVPEVPPVTVAPPPNASRKQVVQSFNGHSKPVDTVPAAALAPDIQKGQADPNSPKKPKSLNGIHSETPQTAATTVTVIGETITLTPIPITRNGQKGTRYAIPPEMQDKYYGFVRLDPEKPDYEAGDIKSLLSPSEIATQSWALLPNSEQLQVLLNFIYSHKGENQEDKRYYLDQHLKQVLGKLNQGTPTPGVYSPEYQPSPSSEVQQPTEHLAVHGTDRKLNQNEDGTFALPEGHIFVNAVTPRGMYNAGTILDKFITTEKAEAGTYILVADPDNAIRSLKEQIDTISTEKPTSKEGKKDKAQALLSLKKQIAQLLHTTLGQQGWEQIPWGSSQTDDYGNLLGFSYVPKAGNMLKPGLYGAAYGAQPNKDNQTNERFPFKPHTAYVRFFISEEEARALTEQYSEYSGKSSFSVLPGRYNSKTRETYGAYVVAHTVESVKAYIEQITGGAALDLADGTIEIDTRQHFLLFEVGQDQAFSRLDAAEYILNKIAQRQQAKGVDVPDWVKQGKIDFTVTNFRKPTTDNS